MKLKDNSWMETVAYNFHDEDDSVFKNFNLTAGKSLADKQKRVSRLSLSKVLGLLIVSFEAKRKNDKKNVNFLIDRWEI